MSKSYKVTQDGKVVCFGLAYFQAKRALDFLSNRNQHSTYEIQEEGEE